LRLLTHLGIGGLLLQLASPATASATCSDLAALRLAHTTITAADTVAAGAFVLPAGSPRADPSFFTAFDTLASFCRVQGVVEPVPGSHIEFEVWLPLAQWNGRAIGAGNGGTSGSINYYRLAEAVRDGSAGSATDVGHKDADVRWWEGHPERVADFDHRAIHETAVKTKAIVRAFYGRPPSHTYFMSCSNGGRQGIVEALRYPEDYDGILAGAPAYDLGAELASHPLSAMRPPDLRAFQRRGGKLILYHGGEDHPAASVAFYRKVVALMGQRPVDELVRLYVVPGMGHCGGGNGPDPTDIGERLRPGQDPAHSVARALQAWVETGVAPHAIMAVRPYPARRP
jgi:feruloyl esterase